MSSERATYASRLTAVKKQDREAHARPLDMGLLVRLFKLTRPYARRRNVLLVLVVIRAAQLASIPFAMAWVIKGPIAEKDWAGILWGVVAFFLLTLTAQLVFHYRQKLGLTLGEAVVYDLRNQIFEKLQRMSMRYYNRTKLGRLISRMTSDAEHVRMGVQNVFFVTMVQAGQMACAAGFMLYQDAVLFGALAVMVPALWMINQYYRSRISQAWRDVQESFSRVTATLAESVNGIRTTQGFVREDVNASLFSDLVADHGDYNLRAMRLQGTFLPLLELNSQFFTAVLIMVAGLQVLKGWFFAEPPAEQFKTLVVFVMMVRPFLDPIAVIGRMYNQSLTAMAGAERVFRLLDAEEEPLEDEDAVEIPPIEGWVEFRDVGFGYDPGKPVLFDVNFVAEPGQTVALVGHTGSGKSTIINLIAKFYLPTEGELLVDGYEVRKAQTESLVQQLGIVLQSNFLFSGTVMDNIRVGKTGASDEEVIEAARKLACLDLFESMPEGFYTEVGERGGNLSLGQRQLVCFTRAMLADPRILILDEATSSVDTMTEARIQNALSVLLQNRTSFVVAHRLSTIRHADVVLVLDHGRIIERGTHNQLLATGGVYANLYRQFIHASEA
ncbi:MAG: ABC transporter ATP-binding protein [Phycisphaeraceae bacterium]